MPVLDYRNGQFVFDCEYEERSLPKTARFWWDSRNSQWVSQSSKCAIQLIQYATQAARAKIVDALGKFGSTTTTSPMFNHQRAAGSKYRYNI